MHKQITITYSADGLAVSDFDLENQYEAITSGRYYKNYAVSTEIFFQRVRLGIVRGEISHERVLFRFEGQDIHLDKDGDFHPCPEGFLSLSAKMAREIMMKSSQNRIERRQHCAAKQ